MHILIAEHSQELNIRIRDYLIVNGHQSTCVADGITGLHLAATQTFDAAVFNSGLPGISGNQVCELLRSVGRTKLPFILTSTSNQLCDVLQGFKMGADDYLASPFDPSELLARLEAIVRRIARPKARVLEIHDLTYDLDTLSVKRAEQTVTLNPTSLCLLELLMRRSPAVVSRREMLDVVWQGVALNSDTVRSTVHRSYITCMVWDTSWHPGKHRTTEEMASVWDGGYWHALFAASFRSYPAAALSPPAGPNLHSYRYGYPGWQTLA
jgi:DNA-binding response OmpR family regulator